MRWWQVPEGLSRRLAPTLHLVDVAACMQLTAVGQVAAIVPFVYLKNKQHMTLYKGDAALAARREVENLSNLICESRRASCEESWQRVGIET